MRELRTGLRRGRDLAAFALTAAFIVSAGAGSAEAAPIKVACIGEHTTHSHHFPATNREKQPVGKQEYPAMLQTMLGAGYDVRNFGDCCASVMQGYTVQETHPYINGANAGDGPGYKESIAFLPDIVVIGSWGRHDWGLNLAAGQKFTLAAFEAGYDDLIKRYQNLSSHPKIFISLPIPILNGQGDVPDNGTTTSSVLPTVRAVAAKYNLPLIDLYTPFLNHKELFKQRPDVEGEGEHVTDLGGLPKIAEAVYAVLKQTLESDAGTDAVDSGAARDASTTIDASVSEAGGAGGSATGSGGSGGTNGNGGNATAGQGTAGSQGGASPLPESGGANANTPPSMSDSGCSCSIAPEVPSPSRFALLLLGGLGLVTRRRKRHARISERSVLRAPCGPTSRA